MKGCAGGMEGVCRGAPHRKVRGGDMEGYTELCMDCMEEFVEVCREEWMESHEGYAEGHRGALKSDESLLVNMDS